MKTPSDLLCLAMHHERVAKELRKQAALADECKLFPIEYRLVYSATERCSCGLGMSYDIVQDFEWDCSGILLGTAKDGKHRPKVSHSLVGWEIEDIQSTRPKC